jgi:hypothetical protein
MLFRVSMIRLFMRPSWELSINVYLKKLPQNFNEFSLTFYLIFNLEWKPRKSRLIKSNIFKYFNFIEQQPRQQLPLVQQQQDLLIDLALLHDQSQIKQLASLTLRQCQKMQLWIASRDRKDFLSHQILMKRHLLRNYWPILVCKGLEQRVV